MKILDRYLLSEFIKPLVFVLAAFVSIFLIAQLVDEMRGFVDHHPSLAIVVLYYLYRVPYFLIQVMPMAVLLSALFSLGQLARANELIALRACGLSFYRVSVPILAMSLVLVAGVLVFDEVVIPYANPRAEYIKRVKIEGKTDNSFRYQRDNVTRSASGNRILFMRHLDALAGRIDDTIYLELGPQMTVLRRFDAPSAQWQNGRWVFDRVSVRVFDPVGNLTAYQVSNQVGVEFKETPMDFIREEKDTNELVGMTLAELRYRIHLLKETGSNAAKEEVNYHLKFAFPFANFVLALLGVSLPFIFPSGRRAMVGAAIGFVITVTVGFFYIGFIAIGTSLGKNGTLSPVVSVWVANVIFAVLGTYLMRLAHR